MGRRLRVLEVGWAYNNKSRWHGSRWHLCADEPKAWAKRAPVFVLERTEEEPDD